MKVISKQSFLFTKEGADRVVVRAQSEMQHIAEWVRDTELFKHAVKAGKIFEVKDEKPAEPEASAEQKSVEETVVEKAAEESSGNTRLQGGKKKSDQ